MKLAEVEKELNDFAPPTLAEAWDNVGLLIGDRSADVKRAMLCIDYTLAVAEEARASGCQLVIAYHPPLFKSVNRITGDGATELLFDAIRNGIAIYSPHTAWDAMEGGSNDVLADLLELKERKPLRLSTAQAEQQFKLVTFIPAEQVEAVSAAIFEAGAGRIGQYSSCSFRTEGTGTFFGEEGTSPAVGEAGKLEKAPEIKIETVVSANRLDAVVDALKSSHPYETPAFDLVPLSALPSGTGMGRVGMLPMATSRSELVDRIKQSLNLPHVLVAGPAVGSAKRVAVCAGAGGDFLDEVLSEKADVFLTGELRHHDALKATRAGITVIATLHSHSERLTLAKLLPKLQEVLPAVQLLVSQADRDPFQIL